MLQGLADMRWPKGLSTPSERDGPHGVQWHSSVGVSIPSGYTIGTYSIPVEVGAPYALALLGGKG
jgi:hypothetical protein